ncbi:MAG: ChbG/HpnK family deacetylase [Holophagales bacterium]|nr:ChbG/HpnK family deacetylase [Holophagales bacterium]MYF96149.1 ChbG/HpnK family deacetylase [Holophagales bacterium]
MGRNSEPARRFGAVAAVVVTLCLASVLVAGCQAEAQTYAEKLGFPAGTRAVILHVDDAGMSRDSNVGALRSILEGAANSMSVMMPCPWVPELVRSLEENPGIDAGLHLTLTAEWDDYRWGPLVGREAAPGLVDPEGALWSSVAEVVAHASPDEVEAEIREQIRRARTMGFEPTHLDSHMGTLFATMDFLERYIEVGIEEGIPLMFPGGHNEILEAEYRAQGRDTPPGLGRATELGERIWDAGLPVLDDLHTVSYGWVPESGADATDEELTDYKVERYVQTLRDLRPGVTMVILHSTDPSENFKHISSSGPTRKGDMLAMLDPRVQQAIEDEGLVLTTFRELKERRDRVD